MLTRFYSKYCILLLICIGASFSVFITSAQEITPSADDQNETQRAALIRVVDEGVTPGNFDIVKQLVAEDYALHSPLGELDRDGVIGFFGALRASLTDFKATRDQVIVEGKFGATRTTITGTFDKDFPSPLGLLKPNHKPIVIVIINMFRFNDDGLIAEEWAQFDALGFFTQLGALPAPTSQ